jgi:hypothetical protein
MKENLFKITFRIVFTVLLGILIVSSSIMAASAYKTFYSLYVQNDNNKIEFLGENPGEQFGGSIAGGDINDDGIDDLIVGSPYYSSEDMVWNGKVSVFLGKARVDVRHFDLKNVNPDLVVYGGQAGDQLGISVASGDFNDDGLDDVLMGAYNSRVGEIRPGKAFLMFGRKYYEDALITLSTEYADAEFIGEDDLEGFGMSVHMADFDNDDLDDILIGAPFAMSIGGKKTGSVYGYEGWSFDVDSVDGPLVFEGSGDADTVFVGKQEGERFGAEINVGDVVGGLYNDVVISAYFADGPSGPQSGKVYIYKGLSKYQKYSREPYDVLVGQNPYDWFGFSVDVGSSDSHHKDDLLISTFPYPKNQQGSTAYFLSGRSNFSDEDYYVNEGSSDYYFSGNSGDELMGASVEMADLDGDLHEDLVVGSPGIGSTFSKSPGEVYVFYNKYLSDQVGMNVDEEEMTSYIVGENPDDWFGAKMASLDFNGDGYDDLVVSSRYFDRFDQRGLVSESDNGKVYLLFGRSAPFGDYQIVKEPEDEYVTRGEFVERVIDGFDIKNQRKLYIDTCYQHKEFCFFAFSGQSNFDGLSLYPELVLYPDVPVGSEYYESVNVATMLGLVSGFVHESETPFKPEASITRMEALKVILGANKLVEPVFRFELIEILGDLENVQNQFSYYEDIDPSISHMWWYPRFANFAYEHALVSGRLYFRPDDFITKAELDDMIERTYQYLNYGTQVSYLRDSGEYSEPL